MPRIRPADVYAKSLLTHFWSVSAVPSRCPAGQISRQKQIGQQMFTDWHEKIHECPQALLCFRKYQRYSHVQLEYGQQVWN